MGTLPELLKGSLSWVEVVAEGLPEGTALPGAGLETISGQSIIKLNDPAALDRVLKEIMEAGGRIVSVNPQRENLESYFARQVRGGGEVRP
jgi:hypothetical protein